MEVSNIVHHAEENRCTIDKGVNNLVVVVLVPLQKQVPGTDWPTYLSR
jgi:hypothetical protein